MRRRSRALLPALVLAFLAREAGAGGDLSESLRAKSPAIVQVKSVLKLRFSGGGRTGEAEHKIEVPAVVVDPSGLVMLTNLALLGDSGGLLRAALDSLVPGAELVATPTDLKVLVGDDAKEHEAIVVARDSQLGLAFLQITGDAGAPFASVDLSKGSVPRLGQPLFGVSRLSRAFDYAPEVKGLYARRRIEQPRVMWGVAGEFDAVGLPAFDMDGAPVGVLSAQGGADGGGLDFGALDASSVSRRFRFLLPLDVVAKAVEVARKRVPEALAKAKADRENEAKDAAPAGGPAMAEPPAMGGEPAPPK